MLSTAKHTTHRTRDTPRTEHVNETHHTQNTQHTTHRTRTRLVLEGSELLLVLVLLLLSLGSQVRGKGIGAAMRQLRSSRRKTYLSDRQRMRQRYRAHELQRTDLGSVVICDDKDLLFEEAPDAYKRIDDVVNDLLQAGACRVLATLRPMLTYNTRDA